jgi:ribosome maturation factor RimP
MAKTTDISSLKDFVGLNIVATLVKRGSEEITGEITSVKDGVFTLVQESRGSTYTYRFTANEMPYVKSEKESEFKKGETITVEREVNKRTKIVGTVVAIDGNSVIVDLGEKRGALVTSVFPLASLEEISYRAVTAEGKKAREKKSARLKEARAEKSGSKKSKGDKGEKKSGKKLKLLKRKAA